MEKRPNILFILSDDQSAWSLGCYGNQEVITPTLDSLCAQGARFDSFYCTSPVCSPARASLLTGRMPSQHGVLDWLGGGSVDKRDYADLCMDWQRHKHEADWPADRGEEPGPGATVPFSAMRNYQKYMSYERGPIPFLEGQTCYSELLAQAGYVCGLAGKWHLGDSYHPQKGFSYWQAVARGGTAYTLPDCIQDGKPVLVEQYVTDWITDRALDFLDQRKDEAAPFYLSVHYTAPHDPWEKEDQPADIWALYENCPFDSVPRCAPHPDQVPMIRHPRDPRDRDYLVHGYYTCITAMDRAIGRLLARLEENGQRENTLIFFTGDNGLNLGHHGIWGKGNGTFPMNMFESSVRVPFLACGPGVLPGQVYTGLYSHYDVFPTLLELAGCTPPATDGAARLPGRSFAAALRSGQESTTGPVVVYDEYGPVRMIRAGRYKLVYRMPYGPHELYDLDTDPQEVYNRIQDPALQEVKYQLGKQLLRWFQDHSLPEFDGSRYPVDGRGQMARLADFSTGNTVFRNFF